MFTSRLARRTIAVLAGSALFAAGALTAAGLDRAASGAERSPIELPAFGTALFLSHVNDPSRTPLFPGDPAFTIETVFTVRNDGFYLERVTEGTHTGTHYSAPCHFHNGAISRRPTSCCLRSSSTSGTKWRPTPTTSSVSPS
jgi:hypothetical protein